MTSRRTVRRGFQPALAATALGVHVGPKTRGPGKHKTGRCTSGKHPMVSGEPRCAACRSERDKARRAKIAHDIDTAPLLSDMPSKEILDGAVCGPATAKLFDPIKRDDQLKGAYQATLQRVESAMDICYTCPVRSLCLADAYAHRRVGVFGGEYLSPASHSKQAKHAGDANRPDQQRRATELSQAGNSLRRIVTIMRSEGHRQISYDGIQKLLRTTTIENREDVLA